MATQTVGYGTEIYLEYGEDFIIQPNGDLLLAQNSPTSAIATQQRIERLLNTAPYIPLVNPYPDDPFNPSYGVGLPALVGQSVTPALEAQIQAAALKGLNSDPTVASVQQVSVQPIPLASGNTGTVGVTVTIKATASNGQPIVLQVPKS